MAAHPILQRKHTELPPPSDKSLKQVSHHKSVFMNAIRPTPPTICIDGPIGAGKTTVIEEIVARLEARGKNVYVVTEQIDVWRNWCGEDWLQRSIERKDNVFAFQVLVYLTYMDQLKQSKMANCDVIITERGPWTAVQVFSKLALESGQMSEGEYRILDKLAGLGCSPTAIIGLWGDNFDELNGRVQYRDGRLAKNTWTASVYGKYKELFVYQNPILDIVDCLRPLEKVATDVLANVLRVLGEHCN